EARGLARARREQWSPEAAGWAVAGVIPGGRGSAPAPLPAPAGPGDSGAAGGRTLLGSGLDERGLRFGLERAYRTLARLARSGEERIDLVERANRYRPRTWV